MPRCSREVRPAPPRYRNEIGKFSIRRASTCVACGRCVEVCPHGVHVRPDGYRHVSARSTIAASGPTVRETDHYCVDACPQQALSLAENPAFETLGDYRWTPDLLVSTWQMAETGRAAGRRIWRAKSAARAAASTACGSASPRRRPPDLRREDISTELLLNRRDDSRPKIDDRRALVRRRHVVRLDQHPRAAGQGPGRQGVQHLHLHGRGRISRAVHPLRRPRDHPGGHGAVRRARGDDPAGAGSSSSSTPRGPSRAWAATCWATRTRPAWRPCARRSSASRCSRPSRSTASTRSRTTRSTSTGSRTSTPGRCSRPRSPRRSTWTWWPSASTTPAAHIVHLDGSYGGTGAAPNIAKKNIAMPIEYAISRVHQFLVDEGIRDKVTVIASGGIRTPVRHRQGDRPGRRRRGRSAPASWWPWAASAAARCESGRGCARGIATTDAELLEMVTRRVVHPAAGEPVHRLARDAGRHPLSPGARLRGRAARPDRPVDAPGLRDD